LKNNSKNEKKYKAVCISFYLMEKKVQLLVEMATKKYGTRIKELEGQLMKMQGDVDTLRTNVKGLRSEPVQTPTIQPLPVQEQPTLLHEISAGRTGR